MKHEDKALLAKYRKLPNKDKELIAHQAGKLVEETIKSFIKALKDTPGVDDKIKENVLETIWGFRRDIPEKEALDDNSTYSKRYNVAFTAAVVAIMQDRENAKNN